MSESFPSKNRGPWDPMFELTALEQAEAIRTGRFSSEELTQRYLDRIDFWNGTLNAFVEVYREAALANARHKDAMVRAGVELPPFHGVPLGIKDLHFVRGMRTRMGSQAMPHFRSPLDDLSVRCLRRGGFVFVGKLSTSELGAMPVTEPAIHPPARNPWNLGHTPGGSSGGSAAAVAACLLPLAHGSDGAGSIRIPAAFCHLFGFKPSRGLLPNHLGSRDPRLLYTCGPIARTVDDAAAMLEVMAYQGSRLAFRAAPLTRHRFRDPLHDPGTRPVPALRIALTCMSHVGTTHPEIASVARRTALALAQLGHFVEERDPPHEGLDEFIPLWQRLITTPPLPRRRMQPMTQWLVTEGRRYSQRTIDRLHDELSRRTAAWLDTADVWLTPAVPQLAPRVGAFSSCNAETGFRKAAVLAGFTAIHNLTGRPAATVPVGLSDQGLPIGVQLSAPPGADALLLSLCKQLERVLPFRQRIAPICIPGVGRPA